MSYCKIWEIGASVLGKHRDRPSLPQNHNLRASFLKFNIQTSIDTKCGETCLR